jgi:hypothetical protein
VQPSPNTPIAAACALVLAAGAIGCGGGDGKESSTANRRSAAARKVDARSQAAIQGTIANYLAAGRRGDAERFCGEQTDARLRRLYGSLGACLRSREATRPDRSIPPLTELRAADAVRSGPRRAFEALSTRDGRRRYVFVMVDERGPGGWAVDEVTLSGG